MITVGTLALSNPDLVVRLKTGSRLNAPDPATFYGGGEAGYLDYPTVADADGSALKGQPS